MKSQMLVCGPSDMFLHQSYMQSCTNSVLTDVSTHTSWEGISINDHLLVLGDWGGLASAAGSSSGLVGNSLSI